MSLERKFVLLVRAVIVAGLLWLGGTGYAIYKNAQAIDQITAERSTRINTVAQILDQGCSTDNGQDKLLAKLIAASLSQTGGFGEGIDPSTLTPFDLQVLATIAKVTAAQPQSPLTDKFRHILHKLRHLTDCTAIVDAYLNGTDIPNLASGEQSHP